jgi:hypothetical protein
MQKIPAAWGAYSEPHPLRIARRIKVSVTKMGRKGKKRKRKNRVVRIPPDRAEARDAGPRLLPLTQPSEEQTGLERYLYLADIALRKRPLTNKK